MQNQAAAAAAMLRASGHPGSTGHPVLSAASAAALSAAAAMRSQNGQLIQAALGQIVIKADLTQFRTGRAAKIVDAALVK